MHHFSFSRILIEKAHVGHPHKKKSSNNATGILFMLKRSSPQLTPPVKLSLCKSMILPVLLYESVCWFASATNTKVLRSVQKKNLKGINSTCNNKYKELLYCNRIIPLSLYQQLQDLHFPSEFLTGHFNFNIDQFVCLKITRRSLRSDNKLKFDHSKPRLEICQQSSLVNRLPQCLQFGNATGLKSQLLNFLWHHFEKRFTTN